jgi:hypothetical protein
MSPNIGDEGDDEDAHPSTFPCPNFLSDAGILDDFLLLVDRVGLTTYMLDESNQYATLTKIFVESFKFTNSAFKPSIAFKIYDKSISQRFLLRALNLLTPPSSHLLPCLGQQRSFRTDPLICWSSTEGLPMMMTAQPSVAR